MINDNIRPIDPTGFRIPTEAAGVEQKGEPMRAIDADAIVVHKFPSEDYDPSENDAEKAYRKGWNDALDAVAEFQPSVEPEETLEEAEEGIDAAFKKLRDARVTVLPSAEPETCAYWDRESNFCALHRSSAQPEIIRCKDCKHKHLENMVWTCPFGLPAGENFFCGYAERRTDDR